MRELVPVVTVMIPTYNQSQFLHRSVSSALSQDYPGLEVLVVDDASTDDTHSIVDGLLPDPRLKYYRNLRNIGRVSNYRRGLYELATGKYVINLDGDDWFVDKSYIRRAVTILEESPSVVMVFANAWYYRESDGSFTRPAKQNMSLDGVVDGDDLFLAYSTGSVWIPHLTAVYRRDVATELDFYRFDIIGSDTESLLRLLLGRKVAFVDRTVAAWRVHVRNASKSLDIGQRMANLACVTGPYEAAVASRRFDQEAMRTWRIEMMSRLALDYIRAALAVRAYVLAVRFFGVLAVRHPGVAPQVLRDAVMRLRRGPDRIERMDEAHTIDSGSVTPSDWFRA